MSTVSKLLPSVVAVTVCDAARSSRNATSSPSAVVPQTVE